MSSTATHSMKLKPPGANGHWVLFSVGHAAASGRYDRCPPLWIKYYPAMLVYRYNRVKSKDSNTVSVMVIAETAHIFHHI